MTITYLETGKMSDVIYATLHLCKIVSPLCSFVTGAQISRFKCVVHCESFISFILSSGLWKMIALFGSGSSSASHVLSRVTNKSWSLNHFP